MAQPKTRASGFSEDACAWEFLRLAETDRSPPLWCVCPCQVETHQMRQELRGSLRAQELAQDVWEHATVADVLDVFGRVDTGEDVKFLRLTILLSAHREHLARL